MLHRTQQLRIDARQSRQGVGIDPIILAAALPDQTHVARMGHDGLASQADQQPLTHGECIPVSSAIRLRGILPNTARSAFGVVETFSSRSICPLCSTTQYQLDRSPRSNPIVSFSPATFSLVGIATVLIFFIAGLLYLLCFEHVDNLGAYRIPSETGLLIPSDYVNYPIPGL